ncbi:MAG: DegT/DnrJ/EryC1/StrS family aminotransferase [Planctomycetota bacterium]
MTHEVQVPFADVPGTFAPIRPELDAAIAEILDTGRLVQGRWVSELETSFAAYLETEAAVAVSSGTSALELCLRALDVGPGDEVITTAMTFIATAEAICTAGATPVLADVDPRTLQIDPEHVRSLVGPRTVGILPVHLFGAPSPMDELLEIADAADLWVVEDAAQAHGALYRGRRAGSLGVASCFSFYPGKNLGAAGEGGMVATGDPSLAERVRMLRDHGSVVKYQHTEIGYNARMSEIEAASVALKLPLLDAANDRRRGAATRYAAALQGLPLEVPGVVEGGTSVHHLYVVQCAERESLRAHLDTHGVQSGLHYPLALHQQPALRHLETGALPHAARAAASVVSLPMFAGITDDQVDRVADALRTFFERSSAAAARSTDPARALAG